MPEIQTLDKKGSVMKLSKILICITFCVAITFAVCCWTRPFDDVYDMPQNLVVNSEDYSEPISALVQSKYNKESNTVDFLLLNTLKIHSVNATETRQVYLGGDIWGFDYDGKGVLVVSNKGLGEANTELLAGDVIIGIDESEVNCVADIAKALNSKGENQEVSVKLVRDAERIEKFVKPKYDSLTKRYKLGVWAQEGLNGVGTVTYIDAQTGRFGALGHPIVEPNSQAIFDVDSGKAQKCVVLGVKKADRGSPGEIRAILPRTKSEVGIVDKNCETGIYGTVDLSSFVDAGRQKVELGGRLTAKPGKATIYSCIDGKNIRPYEIEIIKTNFQGAGKQKNLVFRVTDDILLKTTGGIVQGMSGSPIVQNGKLIGAITHVFVNDPTKGFGIYIDNMVTN